jgi:RES domain-containing protein
VNIDLPAALSSLPGVRVRGRFFRYAPSRARLVGGTSGGRWSPAGGFPAIYFADSRDSAIVEIYRRIIDAFDPPLPADGIFMELMEVAIDVQDVLDLRELSALKAVGLTITDLRSDVGDYASCHRVGKVVHQHGYHGILAQAASGVGNHFAVFDHQLTEDEHLKIVDVETLNGIPANPRNLRLVTDDDRRTGQLRQDDAFE